MLIRIVCILVCIMLPVLSIVVELLLALAITSNLCFELKWENTTVIWENTVLGKFEGKSEFIG